MVQPLHRNKTHTPTRCALMMAEPSGDWHVFKQIFADHWEECQQAHPRYQTSYYDGLVATMLGWGNPEQMGSGAYRCRQCGVGKHRVAMRCQSSLCLRCAKVYVDNWVRQVSKIRHEGVLSRHILLTVPAMCRTTFSHNATVLLRALMRGGVPCMDDCLSEGRGKALRGGSIAVMHTHGRHGHSHPHRHLIATSGGDDGQGQRWEHVPYFPYALLRRTWQWHLLSMVRKTLKSEAINRLVEGCFTHYPNGLVPKVHKGKVPSG